MNTPIRKHGKVAKGRLNNFGNARSRDVSTDIKDHFLNQAFLYFRAVHRSYLIALGKIDSYTPDDIYISNNCIPIGKLYRMQVLSTLSEPNGSKQ